MGGVCMDSVWAFVVISHNSFVSAENILIRYRTSKRIINIPSFWFFVMKDVVNHPHSSWIPFF